METIKVNRRAPGVILGQIATGPSGEQMEGIKALMDAITPSVTCRFCKWTGAKPETDECPRCKSGKEL